MSALPPKSEVSVSDIPENLQRAIEHPDTGLTDRQCPRDNCTQRLVYTGTRHNDITDDAGYVVRHKETETWECLAGHSIKRDPSQYLE